MESVKRLPLFPKRISMAVTTTRTALEDRTLQAQLEGYATYARWVRYRLRPNVC